MDVSQREVAIVRRIILALGLALLAAAVGYILFSPSGRSVLGGLFVLFPTVAFVIPALALGDPKFKKYMSFISLFG